ncbi:unnamed protein product [Orchesella dallaii]|uniref:Ion transport domain-containing protein n=1 Tax=Orchesella dallaii TaxID=48710 RepID=A0ABP1RCM1_9HEXA
MTSESSDAPPVIKINKHNHRDEFYFLRSELFHQMLMEDFNFLDAARSYVGNHEPPAFNYSDVSKLDNSEDSQRIRTFLEGGDFFFLCLFVAEIILKFLDDFGGFWSEGWNVFDFMITATSLAAPVLDLAFPNSDENDDLEPVLTAVKYLRIIRIFRSLNVVTRIHKIQLIWGAVVKTFTAMIYITALMSIFFYIFAIIGIQAFDRYTHSHLPQLRYRLAFSNLHNSFVTLFQIFTLDQWYDVIEDTAIVMGYPLACTYILIWILLGSFIFRNIFVGVMVNNFQNIRQSLIEQSSLGSGTGKRSENVNIFALDAL